MTALYRYRLGNAQFDEAAFELRVDGELVDIQRRPLQVLSILLAQLGQAVSHEDFFRLVWRGAPTVPHVLANAVAKLRTALGPELAGRLVNVPRVGYRLDGPVERTVIAEDRAAELDLKPGAPLPGREHMRLEQMLGSAGGHEVWLARHAKTGQARVFKFALRAEQLSSLKREVTLSRLLQRALGERPEFVPVLDWNFSGSPFFIESDYGGQNLADWAATAGQLAAIPLDQRLALLVQIAQAVALAHGVAVLHKDLKPSNVLISPTSGVDQAAGAPAWRCRLVDFGSGRLLQPDQLDALGLTALGLTVDSGLSSDTARNTLRYAAPELLADEPATVHSDIYALGVLLYQLAVADFSRGLDTGWERDLDDELLCEDIARATDRDPARRHRSAAELAEAVAALPQRRAQREDDRRHARQQQAERAALQALRQRRPWLYGLVGVLAAGLAGMAVMLVLLQRSQGEARQQLATSQALNRFLIDDVVAAANPAHTGRHDMTVAEALARAARRIDTTLAQAQPAVRAVVHSALQRTFYSLSDYTAALLEGERALFEWDRVPRPDVHDQIRLLLSNVYVQVQRSQFDKAEQGLTVAEKLIGDLSPAPSALRARWLFEQGGLLAQKLQLEPARAATEQAWQLAHHGDFDEPDLAEQIELSLSDLYKMVDRPEVAVTLARDLMARQLARWGDGHVRTCYTAVALAGALGQSGRPAQGLDELQPALACLIKAVGESSRLTLSALEVHARLLYDAGQFEAAALAFEKVTEVSATLLGDQSLAHVDALSSQARALRKLGRLPAARHALVRAMAAGSSTLSRQHPTYQLMRFQLAQLQMDERRTDQVASLLDGLDADALSQAEAGMCWSARLNIERARLALLQSRPSEASSLLQSARASISAPTKCPDEYALIDGLQHPPPGAGRVQLARR